jgi:hypothetical protein
MLDPSSISILQNRANLLLDLDRAQVALDDADRAVALRPENASSHHIRGNCLRILEQPELALEAYRTALGLAPKDSVIHFCHATVLIMLGRHDEAIVGFGEAIALQPDYVEARVNRSILLLLKGDLKAGFQDHEWRYRREIWPDRRWRGDQLLAGKSILLYCDDGLGDTIQFGRYAALLADQGAIVTLAPQRPLMALMSTLDPRVNITVPQVIHSEPAYDLHCPLLSVPAALRTTLESIPSRVPYLSAEPERLERWRARIGGEGLRIGVCWQGSTDAYDVGRSFPIAQMADIARMQGVRLISLHKGAGEAQLDALPSGMKLEVFADLDADGGAFLDSAAVMLCCDLVITSDTAVAHLAGALVVETWVALRKIPAWRWLLDRPDTPWYPTMTLFRQETDGDWSGLFSRMSSRLRERLGAP